MAGTCLNSTFSMKLLNDSRCSNYRNVNLISGHVIKCLSGPLTSDSFLISTDKSECAAKFQFAIVFELFGTFLPKVLVSKHWSEELSNSVLKSNV